MPAWLVHGCFRAAGGARRYGGDVLGPVGSVSGRWLEEADQFADGAVLVVGVAERELVMDLVLVAAPVAGLGHVAGLFELVDDVGRRAFGYADVGGDVSHPERGVGGDAREHMGVVGDEPPEVVVARAISGS
jgi:hypothetical protein